MKDKYGVFDLGMDEAQNRLISPEYTTPMEALRRLADVFDDHDAQPQIYAVKNIATGVIIGKVRRNVAALKVQREQRPPVLITRFRVWLQTPNVVPVWTGIELAEVPEYVGRDQITVAVRGNGHNLKRLIASRRDIFAACIEMKPDKREGSSGA